jgi:hypothetical protein
MASLFGSFIIAACIGTQGNFQEACTKAVDAGTRQVGLRQEFDTFEDNTYKFVENKVRKEVTPDGVYVLSSAAFAYNTVKKQKLVFTVPNLGICNQISNEIAPNSYLVVFRWKL